MKLFILLGMLLGGGHKDPFLKNHKLLSRDLFFEDSILKSKSIHGKSMASKTVVSHGKYLWSIS